MFNLLQWSTGVILILIYLKAYFPPIESHDCRSKIIKADSLYVDCVDRNLSSIPQDINENLEILNMSQNPLTELNEDDIDKYGDLEELTIKQLKIAKISPNFFTKTKMLRIIDISSTCFYEPIPKLPLPVERIVANSIFKSCSKVSLPEMVELEHLMELECRENNLNDLPSLNKLAPVQFVDLSNNPMKNLKYTDIASLCILSQLNLFGTELGSKTHHNQCCGLKKWGDKYGISIILECDKTCEEMEFDTEAIAAFNLCANTPGSTFFPYDYIIFEILVFVTIVLSIGYLAFRHFKSDAMKEYRQKVQEMEELENEEDHEYDRAAAEGEVGAGAGEGAGEEVTEEPHEENKNQ